VTILPTPGGSPYGNGAGTFHPEEQRIVRGAEISGTQTIDVDVCVIGSGAGGAPVAKELAEGGMRVAILEEGEWWDTDQLTARPREMTAALYRDAGQVSTIGTPPIVLPLGRAVGGTTLVNSGTCFRTPPAVLERWRSEHGLDDMTLDVLEPCFRRVETEINVAQVPEEVAGPNALTVRAGAQALGLSGDFLYRNVRGCVGSGVCAYGCPSGAKQHVGVTYVPRAWAAGATTYTGTRATGLARRRGRVTGVVARTAAGGALHVRAEHTIVACGSIHTPLFLRGQGLGRRSGQLGRNLSIHPATAVRAVFDQDIGMWDGVPQSYYVDELAGEGIMLEGIAGPPDHIAMATPRMGDEHRELMLQARRMSSFGVMVSDTSRGRVRALAGRPQIRYDLNAEDAGRFKRGLELLTNIYWAAGARAVILPVAGVPTLRDGDSGPLRDARVAPHDLALMAFHPLGTARAGADPTRSVVDPDLRVHGVDGLHVADGSVVPSALGVNPQITIMALATRLAFHLLGKDVPAANGAPPAAQAPVSAGSSS
jgi:choline dehydrogenase-like flavoprotein